MKNFKDIEYATLDFEGMKQRIRNLVETISNTGAADEETFRRLDDEFLDFQKEAMHFLTIATVKYIESYIDGTDETIFEEVSNVMQQLSLCDSTVIYEAISKSPYRKHFEDKFGKFLLETQVKESELHQTGEEFMIKEQELLAQLHKTISDVKFDYDGREISATEIDVLVDSDDPEVRKKARYARLKGFADRGDEFASLMDEIVKVRTSLAKANGFDNYLEYENVAKSRFSYGEKELQKFCDNVKKHILPLVEKSNKKIQERLGLERYTSDDTEIYFADGNAKPLGDAKFIREKIQEMYDDMSPRLSELFHRMNDNGYMDIEPSDKKITGLAFTIKLPEEKAAFIFANYVSDAATVNSVIHESGHSMQEMLCMDKYEVLELLSPVQDMSELPSKSMELISYEYADKFFGEDADKYIKGHLAEFLAEIGEYCRWNEFETFLYGNPDATIQERIDKFNELYELYEPGVEQLYPELVKKGGRLYKGMNIFKVPRYVISYSICDLAAIYVANEFKKDKKKGADMFIKLCEVGNSMDYNDSIEYLGLKSAFDEEVIIAAAEYLKNELELD